MTEEMDEIVKGWLDSCIIDSEGNFKSINQNIPKHEKYQSILISKLLEDKIIQRKMNYARYYLFDDKFPDKEVRLFLYQMKHASSYSFNEFKSYLLQKLEKLPTSDSNSKFEVYYSLNAKIDKPINQIEFKDVTISFFQYENIKNIFNHESLTVALRNNGFKKEKHSYIKATIYANNSTYAIKNSIESAYLLMGFIAFSQNYRTEFVTKIGKPKPYSYLKIKLIVVFKDDLEDIDTFSVEGEEAAKYYELNEEVVSNLNTLLNTFQSRNIQMQELIHKAITIYYNGLTEKNLNYSFLSYWTVFEIVALKSKSITHAEVKNRIKSCMILEKIDEYQLDRLYSLRNNLIHDGSYSNITQIDRNLIKSYAETSLNYLIFVLSAYNPSEIEIIYHYLSKDKECLERNIKFIDVVRNLKGYDK